MKVLYRQAASDDIVRQFHYYVRTANAPDIAVRFREAVRRTIHSLRQNPKVGPRYSSSDTRFQNLRSWRSLDLKRFGFYYVLEQDVIQIIRILHGKRDVRRILQSE